MQCLGVVLPVSGLWTKRCGCPESSDVPAEAISNLETVLKPMFNPKKQKLKEYELGASSEKKSGQPLEQQKHKEAAQRLMVLMDDSIRARMHDGLSEVPPQQQMELVERAVSQSGGTDALRGAFYAFERLKTWYVKKFGVFGGF